MDKKVLRTKFFENREYYEVMTQWHADHGGLALDPIVKDLLVQILDSFSAGRNVLEMGCGEGSVIKWFAERYPDLNFSGIDISPHGVEIAQRKSHGIKNINFFVDDIESSKIQDNSIDLIISCFVIEHLSDYKKALKECYRLLRPSGKFLINVENGGRKGRGCKGLLMDLSNYFLRTNKAIIKFPTFDLDAKTKGEKLEKHQLNFDLVEIPSDVLISDLKEIGYSLEHFSTSREMELLSEKYINGSWLKKRLKELFFKLNFFPFNHMGPITIVISVK